MNMLLNSMKSASNYTYTENGGLTHKTTNSALLDMFAQGAAMRKRSDADIILMFKKAYQENPVYALKCLFYIRDVRGGQGERRFFRVCMEWLAFSYADAAQRNLKYVSEFGRWDDLYCFVGTPLENAAFKLMKEQFMLDLNCKTPSLLAKWLHSENASSKKNAKLGELTCRHFGISPKKYRKSLSILRTRINVLEKLMSENRWDEIEFDKIPSKAGLKYKNAFARRDIIKAKYEKFAKDENTKVNAKTLYPYEVVEQAFRSHSSTDRAMVNKYWNNLTDYFNKSNLNALCMVDTSGSMFGTPMNVAISLGLYCAERAGGPFANHYISFSSRPQLIECEGIDFVDKVERIRRTNLCENTNIEAAFDMLLDTARANRVSNADMPKNIIVISDMEFDQATGNSMTYAWGWSRNERFNTSRITSANANTVMEEIARKWRSYGYELPHLIFWNVNSHQNNIPMLGNGRVSYVSGFSPSIFQTIMTGKTGYDLMMEALDAPRYSVIQ